MPESPTLDPVAADPGVDETALFAELEAELARERAALEALESEVQPSGAAPTSQSAESPAEVESADLDAWHELLRQYGPEQVNATSEIEPATAPADAPPAPDEVPSNPADSATDQPGTTPDAPVAETPSPEAVPESSPSSRPIEPTAEAAPEPSPSSRPIEPPPEPVPEASPSSRPVEPSAEAAPDASPSSRPVEPAVDSRAEPSPGSRPVEPAPEPPSVLAAGAFALGAGAVLAGGAAALARPAASPTAPGPVEPAAWVATSGIIAQWFYAASGTTFGPFELDELLRRLREGRLPWETPVWTEGMATWTAASSTELSKIAAAQPAQPATPPRPPDAPRRRRFCHACGTAAEPGDRFCTNCGTALRS